MSFDIILQCTTKIKTLMAKISLGVRLKKIEAFAKRKRQRKLKENYRYCLQTVLRL